MVRNFKYILFISAILIIAGCTSQKKLVYFNQLDENFVDSINSQVTFQHEAKIVVGHMLGITVSGSDPRTVAIFNLPLVSFSSPSSASVNTLQSLQPYEVNSDGTINFPVLGKIKVLGMTRVQLMEHLTTELKTYVQDPVVNVSFMNFRFTVLGEVNRPGRHGFSERTTLIDALGIAGDITVYGKKDNVLIVRQVDGEKRFARLNLNDESIFLSPYFYIEQDDIIYVEPNNIKKINSQSLPLILSTVSSVATIATLIYSISRTTNN